MPQYILNFAGRENERQILECEDVDAARNEAVRYLGSYLAEHPGFADEGHWRVNVEDTAGESLLHVIVATVTARTKLFNPPPERSLYVRDHQNADPVSEDR